jgi:hypothetical protein
VLAPFLPSGVARAATELNPAAVAYKLPDQIPWSPPNERGVQNANLIGDPSKVGFYVNMTRSLAGNHFQPSAFPSARPLHHRDQGYVVGR